VLVPTQRLHRASVSASSTKRNRLSSDKVKEAERKARTAGLWYMALKIAFVLVQYNRSTVIIVAHYFHTKLQRTRMTMTTVFQRD
jgi:hypothetical protein